ncbi:hypothetical protein B0H16DRAFT_1853194 [Mycena metata]|uniref:AB hydrolase-1 domain-containing protein n=1 Tax=Mycena metata TaxID=1033252 RepID=A0AAD7NVN3_9AGAR|nr:hypothetical protein B0H16DRAFT_1853194 [Mycena metata]
MLLYTLAALLLLFPSIRVEASCACSPVVIPVHVNVLVPKDPMDPFAGLKSNASELHRVEDTYDVYGLFCQPNLTKETKNSGVPQLLVHGFSYTSQYWSPPVEEFCNYSYVTFSCALGPYSSLAVDVLGAGLSSRPANSSDVQFPTASAILSQLARLLKTTNSILPGAQTFKTIIGVVPLRWTHPYLLLEQAQFRHPTLGHQRAQRRPAPLDPGYLSLADHNIFYPTDPTSFSPRMVLLDDLIADVGTVSLIFQESAAARTSGYTGPVAKIVGSADRIFCVGIGGCANVTGLTVTEGALWPAAKSFEFLVLQGSGHDMNLDFFAAGTFNMFVRLVKQFSDF